MRHGRTGNTERNPAALLRLRHPCQGRGDPWCEDLKLQLKRPPPPIGLIPILEAPPPWKLQDATHTVSQALLSRGPEGSGATKIQAPGTVHGPDRQRGSIPDLGLQQEGMHRIPRKSQPRIPGRSGHAGQTAWQPGQRLGARRLSWAPGVQLWSVG